MKKGMLMLFLLAAVLLVSGCGTQETGNQPAEATVPLAEKVRGIAADADNLAVLTAEDLTDVLGAEPEDCREFVFLQSDGTDGRELLAIRAADRDTAAKLAGLAEKYLERRLKETRNYAPEAYRLLSETKVQSRNLTVVLAVGPDAAKETEAILAGE